MKTVALCLCLLSVCCFGQTAKQPATSPKAVDRRGAQDEIIRSGEMRTIAFDFLHALNAFKLTVHMDDPHRSTNDVELMTEMMNDNRWMAEGVSLLRKYKGHRNESVRVAAEGTILGAETAKKANTDMLAIMRKGRVTPEELNYQVALYTSRQKEAYRAIYIFAPSITAVMFRPKEKPEQAGPIAYTISKPDRVAILEEIDRLFGDELAAEERGERKDRHNAIVIAVQAIRKNLVADTYEELEKNQD